MIFDWIQNCENIYQTKHFPNSDGQEKKTMVFQHIMLFKFLEEQKGMTKEQVKDFWQQTDSVYLLGIPEDDKEEWIDIEFNKLWAMRERNVINFVDEKNKMVYNFSIYQEEIDYINSLDCGSWLKKALLLLLACSKHTRDGWMKYNYTTTAWIEKTIDSKYKVNSKMKKLGELNTKYHLFDLKVGEDYKTRLKVRYTRPTGTVVAVVYSPNYMKECLELIPIETQVCPECQKEFIPSAKQKTNLCKDCYAVNRKAAEKERLHQLYLIKKSHAGKNENVIMDRE